MKKITISLVCVVVLALFLIVTSIALSRHVRIATEDSYVVEEFKWTYQLLIQEKNPDRLREFLKARLYNLGMQMQPEKLRKFQNIDFGIVDEAKLGTCLAAPPHADSPNEHRQIMLEKIKE